MRTSFADLRARKELLDHYRAYRRGVITLSYLERDLERDIATLGRYIEGHRGSVLQEGFIEIGIQVIETTKDVVQSTLGAVDALMDYVATSGRVMDPVAHARYVRENIRDDEAEQLILNTLRMHGGVEGFLEASHRILLAKQLAYSESVRLAKKRTEESWTAARGVLLEHYRGELETLVGYWERRLKEEAEAHAGQPYFSQVAYELCQRYPDIAKQLGIQCPEEMWPIILIAIACAILCEGD